MSTKIYLVKYISDVRRWEPRNVGLIVLGADAAASRFIGEKPDGVVDRRFVKELVNDTDIYADWVHYFQRIVAERPEGIDEALRVGDSSYWVAEAGEVLHGTAEPSELVDEYFQTLVRASVTGPDEEAPVLKDEVENLLEQARVASSPHLHRDYSVPSTAKRKDGRFVEYKFHYFWENGARIVGERLSDEGPWARNQLWKFSHLPQGILRVAFVRSPENVDIEAELDEVPHLERIDVSADDALDRVVSTFNE